MKTWQRLGLIFCPHENSPWMHSHAANPVADPIDDQQVRIYFSTRDAKNRSSVGSLVIDIDNPTTALEISKAPHLSPGEPGTFDDSGISSGCLVTLENEKRFYYLGWNLSQNVPYQNSIGLALVNNNGTAFTRKFLGPILSRNQHDPFTLSYPFVLKKDSQWHMWYGSNIDWQTQGDDVRHVLKHASSSDGIFWQTSEHHCLQLEPNKEKAFSRPSVLFENNEFHMWYSFRGQQYKIGYAKSKDGIHWTRDDHMATFSGVREDWENQAACYPYVFKMKNRLYMLYCGNGYGKTGFGIAKYALGPS